MGAEQNRSLSVRTINLQRNSASRANWDIKELLERVDDDREFLCELLLIFRQDSETNLQKARAALRDKDLPGLMRAAHTLKGMLRNLSMNRAAEIAYALETSARQENCAQAETCLARLELALGELLPEVEAQLAEVKA